MNIWPRVYKTFTWAQRQILLYFKGENMRLFFANGIFFKVASHVNVKTQIELEIWANCSGHRRKKNFRCGFFMSFRWVNFGFHFYSVFKIAMLALISRFCANRKYEQVSLFCMEWLGLNPPVTSCQAFTVTLSHLFLNQTGLKEKCFAFQARGGGGVTRRKIG